MYKRQVSVSSDSVKDATAFLETFFKLYPTATEKELAYYVKDGVLAQMCIRDSKNPMNFSQDICNFTKQGRNKVHEDVVVVTKEEIRALLENENPADSVEFNDNRMSAYIAQQGNCYVMNRRGTPSTLICIHKSDKGCLLYTSRCV